MALHNTTTRYGAVAKALHWIVALGILTMIPLGIYANGLPYDTSEALAQKFLAFSIHKTLGLAIFAAALIRIGWAVSQPKPASLHPERQLESFLAALVHWVLYGALVLVPLTGWVSHAAASVAGPIWWPFGQSLPFVPKSEALVEFAGGLHIVFERVLVIAILLHVAGALKHHIIDRDATLRRMLPGRPSLPELKPHTHSRAPIVAAVAVYLAAIGAGFGLGMLQTHASSSAQLEAVASDWTVLDGTLAIEVFEQGSDTSGEFKDWTAAISFAETATDGVLGAVDVTIAIGSLALGSVTGVAIGPEFFDAGNFPTASYSGPIKRVESGYFVDGTLTIRTVSLPLKLPFDLVIDEGLATVSGSTVIDRMEFDVGPTYDDPGLVGFDVTLTVALTAQRVPQ